MQELDKYIKGFMDTVCSQIRYKSIHKSISDELTDHICEQKSQYINQGLDEEEAVKKALQQMGDPVQVGKELDKAHRPRTEWSILSLAMLLAAIGGAVQYFLSTAGTGNYDGFSRFLLYAPVGIAAFVATYFFDYTILAKYSKFAYFILFAVALLGFRILNSVLGTYTHVYYLVLLFIPVYAAVVYGFRNRGYLGIIYSGFFYAGPALLCLIAPRVFALLLFTVASLVILTKAVVKGYFGVNKKVGLAIIYIPVTVISTVFALILFLQSEDRIRRILVLINPSIDPQGQGFQLLMVRRFLAASKPFGRATLEENYNIIPGWFGDFSLTYIIACLGYVAGVAIVLSLFILIIRMFVSVNKQKNALGFLISYAACFAVAGQFVIYVLTNFGSPIRFASTLPLVSPGGSGFVVNMILVGLVLSVYRRTDLVSGDVQYTTPVRRLITFEDGKLIIDFRTRLLKKE
jgi:cell division protein FtsW (lipid II flippase)